MRHTVRFPAIELAEAVPPPRITSPTYDFDVMSALRTHHSVSLRALGRHFATRRGRDVSHVLAVVRRLKKDGLVTTWRMDPRQGQRSQMGVSLTPAGHAWFANLPAPAGVVVDRGPPSRSEDVRNYELQLSHIRLESGVDGWSHLPAADVFEALQRRALAVVNGSSDRNRKAELLPRLRKMTPIAIGLDGLLHTSGEVRLLLPVRPGVAFRRAIDKLPCGLNRKTGALVPDPIRRATLGILELVMPLSLVLVCTDARLLVKAKKSIKSWSAKYRLTAMHSVPDSVRCIAHPYLSHRSPATRRRPDPSRTTPP